MRRQPLKGLLMFTLFSAKMYFILAFGLSLLGGIVTLIFGATPVIGMINFALFGPFYLLLNADAMKVDKTKWEKFQLSMPIRRQDVISAKYIFYLLLTVLALLITGVTEGIAHLLNHLDIIQYGMFNSGVIGSEIYEAMSITPRQLSLNATLLILGLSLLTCALYYLLTYSIFKGKEELASVVVLFGNAVISALLFNVSMRMEFTFNQTVILAVLVPALLFVLFYFFTVKVYQKIDV